MDRQGHDYAAPMGYGQQQHQPNMPPQQQQQPFGFHPHQQFPPSPHGPPFLPSHPSMQQYPYPRPMQQQQQQPQYPHPHLLHMQHQRPPSGFPPHHLAPSPYHGSYDSAPPPPPTPPPSDPELQKRIDKLVEYSAKNGPEFENMIREKQQDNPDYGFLFGGEGHNYYRYKLWIGTRLPGGPFNLPFPSSMPALHPPNPIMSPSPLHPPNATAGSSPSLMGVPSMHQSPFPPSYEPHHPQHSQTYTGNGQPDYDHSYRNFRIPSKPLPSDVEMEFSNVLNNLTGTKESIKGAKMWFMQRSPFMPLLAEALKDKIFSMDDSERQLHIIYLVNDILFDSLQRRIDPRELDNEALSFKPVLGSMLSRVYHNPQNREENQSRLQKIVQFWASKEVYDQDSVHAFEYEMIAPPFPGSHRDIANIPADLSATTGLLHQHPANQNASQWHPNRQSLLSSVPGLDKQIPHIPQMPGQMALQQFHPTSVPHGGFAGSMSMPSSVQPAIPQPSTSTANVGEKVPPYPLFPPGLIPGMVRKMQIGSGVPYSPLSPLDIPTVIPPSTATPGEILERVSKFFKEIGEVNPSEGPMKSDSKDDYDEYEREAPVRKGGACIPPPPNLQAGTEFGDGGSSESGRLGLGASGVPRESNQYDDVYSSYRKQRSSNYHTTMSVRSSAR